MVISSEGDKEKRSDEAGNDKMKSQDGIMGMGDIKKAKEKDLVEDENDDSMEIEEAEVMANMV